MARPITPTLAFQIGEHVFLRWEVRDNDPDSVNFETLVDADTATLTITGPDGVEAETDTDITPSVATGIYRFNFPSAGEPVGDWVAEATFTLSTLITKQRLCFTIEAAV